MCIMKKVHPSHTLSRFSYCTSSFLIHKIFVSLLFFHRYTAISCFSCSEQHKKQHIRKWKKHTQKYIFKHAVTTRHHHHQYFSFEWFFVVPHYSDSSQSNNARLRLAPCSTINNLFGLFSLCVCQCLSKTLPRLMNSDLPPPHSSLMDSPPH